MVCSIIGPVAFAALGLVNMASAAPVTSGPTDTKPNLGMEKKFTNEAGGFEDTLLDQRGDNKQYGDQATVQETGGGTAVGPFDYPEDYMRGFGDHITDFGDLGKKSKKSLDPRDESPSQSSECQKACDLPGPSETREGNKLYEVDGCQCGPIPNIYYMNGDAFKRD